MSTVTAPFVSSADDASDEVLDGRTETDKLIDTLMGAEQLTALDRQFGKILKHAVDLFASGKQTRKYLLLAEECDMYLRKALDCSPDIKRAGVIARIEERLLENGIGTADCRVNDWLAVYGLARCVTGCETVKEMPVEFVNTHAYRTLAILKVAVVRDQADYVFKPGWGRFAVEMLETGVKGLRLESACKQHKAEVEEAAETNRIKSMSPKQAAQEMERENAAARDKLTAEMNKAAESIRDKAINANLSPEDLFCMLVTRGIIPPAPSGSLDPVDIAYKMDPDFASKLGAAMVDRGDYKVIMSLAATLQGWLRKQNEPMLAING